MLWPLMGNLCGCKKQIKRKIVLLLVGLDNAGKTVTAKGLAGEIVDDSVVPTVGFSIIHLNYHDYNVKIFDLGGGPNIRDIWTKYFVDAHGIIFVVDSSDASRFDEAKIVLQGLLSNEKIRGKPLLLLANKQDQDEALDEVDIVEKLDLEVLVNKYECPTLLETCAATTTKKIDPNIRKGYDWLLKQIINNYEILNTRVEEDVAQQIELETKIRAEKIAKLRRQKEKLRRIQEQDMIESLSEYNRKISANQINTVETDSETDSSSTSSLETLTAVVNVQPTVKPIKSAVQLVREQLELNVNPKNSFIPRLSTKNNRVAPGSFVIRPKSASAVPIKKQIMKNLNKRVQSAHIEGEVIEMTTFPPQRDADEMHTELVNNFKRMGNGQVKIINVKHNSVSWVNGGDTINNVHLN